MSLYDYIFKRKSVRKYQPEPLPRKKLDEIIEFTKNAKALFPGIRHEIILSDPKGVRGVVGVKAPHYLLFYSEKKGHYLENAGFILQQADLYLSSIGLGSCWVGMMNAREGGSSGMEFIIMLAFGQAAENPHRDNVGQFKRKAAESISRGSDVRLEAARLAPSATNSQSWFFSASAGEIDLYRERAGMINTAFVGRFKRIDMGIALCHIWLSSLEHSLSFNFEFKENPPENPPPGFIYTGSVI